MDQSPSRKGPPNLPSSSFQSSVMRATFLSAASESSAWRGSSSRAMLHSWRRAWKPACISAAAERPMARAMASSGQSFAAGNFSARYSQMASESQTTRSPSFKAGTRPDLETGRMAS